MAAATCTILIHVFSIWNALEAAAVLSVDTPGNYLKSLSLTCNDSTFTVGSAYFWYKAGSTFYSQAGELGSTGRYTHSEVNGAFTLTIKEAVVSDEAMYKCSRQFVFSNEEYVSVQSQSVCAKGKLTSDYLIFECDRVYPLDSVMVICQDKTINGSTTSVVNGDRYDIIWNSTETVELKREQTCNISFNFASRYYRNYTLSNIPVEGGHQICASMPDCMCYICIIICAIGIAVGPVASTVAFVVMFVCHTIQDSMFGRYVGGGLRVVDIIFASIAYVCNIYCLIAGGVGIGALNSEDCKDCTCNCICFCESCPACEGLGIACIVIGAILLIVVTVVVIYKAKGNGNNQPN